MKRVFLGLSLIFIGLLASVVVYLLTWRFAHEEVPFQAGVKGAKAEVYFSVLRTARHSFYLNPYFKSGDPQDPERTKDRERVSKLAGSGAHDSKTKRPINDGLPIPVRLTIIRLSHDLPETIHDKVYIEHELEGWALNHYLKLIVHYKLDAGQYQARIEALDDIPLLQTVPIRFDVHVAHDRL
ncbi:DUF5625 family protein [Methylobacterium nodulans]|uniref:DUF5625 family protein n=1 Tax=Methylobacterium nodulans TaxID=114616 RepID=UPI0012ECD2AD|nr:DUF5625 family protein [Methylobacterium nodulans]